MITAVFLVLLLYGMRGILITTAATRTGLCQGSHLCVTLSPSLHVGHRKRVELKLNPIAICNMIIKVPLQGREGYKQKWVTEKCLLIARGWGV